MSTGLRERVADYPFWYHTIDLGEGVVTPGEWDVGRVFGHLPWPDVNGLRCLDVGTFDGLYAFELEPRGAREVIAVDIDSWDAADLPIDELEQGQLIAKFAGTEWTHGGGFAIAREARASTVERRAMSVYDLHPGRLGTFDLVTCGSLLLHLRDPIAALSAIRSVCHGAFLSIDAIDPWLTAAFPRRPVARFRGRGAAAQWWNPNAAGHRAWLAAAGFSRSETSRPFVVPLASGHKAPGFRNARHRWITAAVSRSRDVGVLHQAVLARPG